jgi:hypothetical protein
MRGCTGADGTGAGGGAANPRFDGTGAGGGLANRLFGTGAGGGLANRGAAASAGRLSSLPRFSNRGGARSICCGRLKLFIGGRAGSGRSGWVVTGGRSSRNDRPAPGVCGLLNSRGEPLGTKRPCEGLESPPSRICGGGSLRGCCDGGKLGCPNACARSAQLRLSVGGWFAGACEGTPPGRPGCAPAPGRCCIAGPAPAPGLPGCIDPPSAPGLPCCIAGPAPAPGRC